MITFSYDNSFEGLLSCIYQAYQQKIIPKIISNQEPVALFDQVLSIPVNIDQAEKVATRIKAISWKIFIVVEYCFLSGKPDKENLILQYIDQALKFGPTTNRRFADPVIAEALNCFRTVAKEAHRFKGLIRFQELGDNTFYAALEPDHCIVPILVPHCQERFSEQNWIIHDTKRDLAAIYRDKEVSFFEHSQINDIREHLSEDERQYQNLWKTFFTSIAIKERTNLKLQRQFLPKKYWKNLVEKQ